MIQHALPCTPTAHNNNLHPDTHHHPIANPTYAPAFLVRPLGALIFGSVGDIYGRKLSLVITLMLMGCSTVLTGCLPTYEQAGAVAPAILAIFRICIGLSMGAEYTTAVRVLF